MDIYDSLFSPGSLLNEQVARQLFECLPEKGPVLIIMDMDGNFWPSDSARFAELEINELFLKEMSSKIDDGDEPLMTQGEDCSIVAAQLSTSRTNCGYIFIALPKYSPEATLANVDLIEMVLNQIGLITKLVEKNNLLYELQMRHHSLYEQNEFSCN